MLVGEVSIVVGRGREKGREGRNERVGKRTLRLLLCQRLAIGSQVDRRDHLMR